MTPTPIPLLTAPTASGKTALALHLAAQHPLEIVSADAFNVYRGLDIGTAKPTAPERARVPHHLVDVVDVTEDYDVARYVRDAETAIRDVLARGRVPLVVGGTGFYLTGLMRGLPLTPPSDPQIRAAVEADLHARGLDALLADIHALNPQEAARMERNPRRIIRALEVHRRTGRFPGEFGHSTPAFTYAPVAFTHPQLEARIAARVHAMFDAGLPAEAAWLATQVPPNRDPRPTAWQAIGYREALAVHHGHLSVDDAIAAVTLATRQYAKRQLTWTRTQLHAPLLDPQSAETHLTRLLTPPLRR
ncbi:tRNA (adenosine(37)-N6)-dimethylallyltransferase MiaA [Deinococcus maricopensis]|uniref:tRNA dimethylallyltransferase n=1 Tax=Deinococcus maricopensis (strain DSM 21211 / LMG 22137 / NRRL B-23946 / LB-34) TaxID=709986 RepID=E8U8Z5_DEIML|nr:tRNA (adenosine(37)-N6)-dimethylallyltransferase MiaA [Deinococcus maricopensis]ADV67534.1 tRNA dimethylallyltransferase [Deinococcus maricopensis DSM 21211]